MGLKTTAQIESRGNYPLKAENLKIEKLKILYDRKHNDMQ